jgi:hypothetical protein
MRFSGHETFAIREGWLFKGLNALLTEPGFFNEKHPSDLLGVGSNMGKSIKHWLLSSGLANREVGSGRKRGAEILVSDFGRLVYEHDPYFNSLGTWCFVHTNLVNSEETTAGWKWFFNHFPETDFVRSDALEQFRRWAKYRASRQPSAATLQKDLNCYLSSYAKKVPPELSEAEEATDCPLWELGLLSYYRGSQHFRVNRSAKMIPQHALGYALSVSQPEMDDSRSDREITFEDAASLVGGPGRTFLMGASALFESAEQAVHADSEGPIRIGSQAGQRTIIFPSMQPREWVRGYYEGREAKIAR